MDYNSLDINSTWGAEAPKIEANFAKTSTELIRLDVATSSLAVIPVFKDPVPTFNALATTYPAPVQGWSAMVEDVGIIYQYNGMAWASTGLTAFPINVATKTDLETKADKTVIYNVTQATGVTYTTKTAARNGVTSTMRGLGQIIAYKLTTGWINEQYIGADVSGWTTDANWLEMSNVSAAQLQSVSDVANLAASNVRQLAYNGLINISFTNRGFYINRSGVLSPLVGYSTTALEKVKEGDVLFFSGSLGDSSSAVFGYSDENLNNPVELLGAGQSFTAKPFTIPHNVNYIRAGGRNSDFTAAPIVPLNLDLQVIKDPIRPVAEQKVWNPLTTFPTLTWMKDFVVSMELYSDTFDKTKNIAIQSIRVNNGVGRTFITLGYVDDINGYVPIASANQIALYDNQNWIEPTLQNGHKYETITFVERNGYKVIGRMKVDWAVIPRSALAYDYFSAYPVKDALLSVNVWGTASGDTTGSIDITHTIDGIEARLITSNTYNVNNTPDHLIIYCHGNGQTMVTGLPSASASAWFKAHGISYAMIKIQDQAYAPFTTRASGWGNDISYNRILKLYNYLMANFNFHKTVIIAGGSMGGLTMGQLAYKKPFPIAFCLGIGIVPGLKIIWNNSVNRREPIRNSFGMAANGSDDANLATFTQGYDWFDMGMLTVNSEKIKVGFPNFYLYYGVDATFTNEFGGVPQYQILRDALLKSGVYSVMGTDGSTAHASPTLYDYAIAQGVFEKELGIK